MISQNTVLDENKIINGLRARNENTFRFFVESYQNLIFNVCYRIVQNKEDADDITQDVFIEVFRSIHNFRKDSGLKTWLYRIAVNKSLNQLKKNKRLQWFDKLDTLLMGTHEQNNISQSDSDIESAIDAKETVKIINEFVQKLPHKQKVAFVLNKYESLSYKEISEIVDIPTNEVGVLINRVKSKLIQKLGAKKIISKKKD